MEISIAADEERGPERQILNLEDIPNQLMTNLWEIPEVPHIREDIFAKETETSRWMAEGAEVAVVTVDGSRVHVLRIVNLEGTTVQATVVTNHCEDQHIPANSPSVGL